MLSLTQSTAHQEYEHERHEYSDDEEIFLDYDTQKRYNQLHGIKDDDDDDDDDEEDDNGTIHPYGSSSSSSSLPCIDSFSSSSHPPPVSSVASCLSWCSPFLESDDIIDLDGGEDEELVELRREYGATLKEECEDEIPTLTGRIEKHFTSHPNEPTTEPSLLRDTDEPTPTFDDWEMLGLECDCTCRSCRDTLAQPSYEQFKAHHTEEDESDGKSQSNADCDCDCFIFTPPESHHIVLLDLFEDFFRFRIHLHRITFAASLERERRRQLKSQPPSSLSSSAVLDDGAMKLAYDRSLTLLKARARRDLKHMELLEVCCNQLGWNQHDAPVFDTSLVFCEVAPPGPSLLAGIMKEFLAYFLIQRTTCTNFDKSKIAVLCTNLLHFAIRTGDLESVTINIHHVNVACMCVAYPCFLYFLFFSFQS